ncbi:MAG TPA: DUF5666 domain-containing protein, partial [Terracidiphilus sp.]|nr:DUF5666 domain-containing protein [Terracidiphilus sp.]
MKSPTSSSCHKYTLHKAATTATIACFTLFLASMFAACSGGSNSTTTSNPPPTPAAKTAVEVNIGDSPADWMLAFSMNITSMSLTGSNGSVSVVSSPTPMEMTHLMGTMQPLAILSAPQGTYSGASITIGSATVMYMDPTTKAAVQATIPGPITANVSFSSPITVGSTPMAMDFDLDLANSVTGSAGGSLSMTPVFHVTSGMQGSTLDPSDGGILQMMGSVSSVSGGSFSMTSMQAAQSFTFTTNSSTVFDGTSMSGMSSGMLVIVDATMQADGSLLATKVQSMMSSGGAMAGGIVTAVTGMPATQLTMVMQNGAGMGMMASDFAAGVTIEMNGSTTYQIDDDNMDISGLPFTPVFDASHIYAGQTVMPISSGGMMSGSGGGMMGGGSMAGTMTASNLELEPQGLSGTVTTAISSGSAATFMLTLPSDCALTTMTGATSVTVYQQTGTTVVGTSLIASGSTV